MTEYARDSQVRLTGTFQNLSGADTDTTVTLYVVNPNQVATSYTISTGVVHDSTGVYHYDLTLNVSGQWYYAWTGTGALIAAMPDTPISVAGTRLR